MTDRSMLDLEDAGYLKNLLLDNLQENSQESLHGLPQHHKVVVPKPGFCVKLREENSERKVFINICQADNLPEPRSITDDELLELLGADNPSDFRVPMSIGEPHAEVDKSGGGCTAYDVVIHPNFLRRVQTSDVMLGFLMTVVMQGLEVKYNLTLARQWNILKHRKFVGKLPQQNIRAHDKPLIQDMSGHSLISEETPSAPVQIENKAPPPPFTMIQEPPEGHPEFLVAEFHLPNVKSAVSILLDVGEDRILLQTRSNVYYLDVYIPYNVIQQDCAAQFNKNTKILTVTMPVMTS